MGTRAIESKGIQIKALDRAGLGLELGFDGGGEGARTEKALAKFTAQPLQPVVLLCRFDPFGDRH